ncbi:porin [Novosphingobium sp. FKTRR1]|uniref:OmpP1/FadL family transporter n=1 Tax=Novosphingobium sp. FKTRR1 TaxID=2879118 RepID=UPI001CF036AC
MILASAALTVLASPALAAGFYIQEQSTKATGRANSGEVADQGVESLWWNPAAIGGLEGGDAAISATAIRPRANVVDNGTLIVRPGQKPALVGGDATRNPIDNGVVPAGAIAHGLGHGLAVGLAISAPYNFTTSYPATSWARYSTLTTRLRTIDIQPSVAVQLANRINLGAALNVEHTTANLGNALPNLLAALPDGQQQLSGKGWDVGYTLGAQYVAPRFSLGVSYKSAITHHLDGQLVISGLLGPLAAKNATIAANARFTTPWQLGFGGRVKLNDAITLNGQVVRFGWAKFDAIRLGSPLNTAIPENYRNTWSYAGGVDVALSPRWTVRGGVQRDLAPVRDTDRDARVPDSDRWTFAVGATHQLTKAIQINAAANYLTLSEAAINRTTAAYVGTPAQTPVLVNGTVRSPSVLIASLGARIRF